MIFVFFLLSCVIYNLLFFSNVGNGRKNQEKTRHLDKQVVGVSDRMESICASSIKKVNLRKHTDLIWVPFFGTLSLRPTLEDDHNTSYGYIVNRTIPLFKMDFMDVFPST